MIPNSQFEDKFAEERLRQARHTFNLAIGCISICIVTTVIGIGLFCNGKTAIGIVTGAAGALPISRSIKFYRDANDRLDEIMEESSANDTE